VVSKPLLIQTVIVECTDALQPVELGVRLMASRGNKDTRLTVDSAFSDMGLAHCE
jgi:hypothetical protein